MQRGSPVVRKISDYANLPIVITFVDRQGPALERSAKYGAYRYLITPVDSPWVMSPLYVWNETAEESGKAFEGSKEMGVGGFPLYEEYAMQMGPGGNHTNRSLGQVYKISRNVHRTWDVTMPDSSEVTLLFVEDDGVPIVNQKVQIAVRFGYDWPNESLPEDFDVGEFTTDAQGYCVFRNPGAFSYSFRRAGDTQSSQWVDTQLFPKDGRFSVYLRGRTSK